MSEPVNVSRERWRSVPQQLAPIVREWRDRAEKERHLPEALFGALREADVLRVSTPSSVGGLELDEATTVQLIEELSALDGAVGWNVMVVSNTATIASYLPSAALREVYAEGPSATVAGALLPKGAARPVPGGYVLTGRWTMASGCQQASWMVACSVVMEDGKPRPSSTGGTDIRSFFLPKKECHFLDTWHTTGLRGTGSHDWDVSEVFVPEHRSFPILLDGERTGGLFVRDFANYAVPRVAAVALGIARDALGSFLELAKTKVPTVATGTLANQHVTHLQVGRAEALLRAGRALLYETVRSVPFTPAWSEPLTDEQRASLRMAGAHAAKCAAEVVDIVFKAAGTSGIYSGSRIERAFRDVHVASQHINVAESNLEMVGQYLLGLGLQFRR